MNVYHNIEDISFDSNSIITIGTFDGVHIGHQNILKLVCEEQKNVGGRSFLVTFNPHPRVVVNNGKGVQLLTTLEEKLKIFEEQGMENILVLPFTRALSQTDYSDFIQKYLVEGIGTRHIVIGYDHKFGKDRSGNEDKLKELGEKFGFKVTTVAPVETEGVIVSSTKIRKALNSGFIDVAKSFLGRSYEFTGNIVSGEKRGRELGFPTANVELNDVNKLIPLNGVYAVKGKIKENLFCGLMNIGVRPTFEHEGKVKIEIHLFDFNDFVYGETLTVNFLQRIRDEKKFESIEDLIHQIKNDVLEAEKIIKNKC